MATAEEITLHGGPKHGEVLVVPEGMDWIEVETFIIPREITPDEEGETLSRRKGCYSRVGKTHDFEWDGWRVG